MNQFNNHAIHDLTIVNGSQLDLDLPVGILAAVLALGVVVAALQYTVVATPWGSPWLSSATITYRTVDSIGSVGHNEIIRSFFRASDYFASTGLETLEHFRIHTHELPFGRDPSNLEIVSSSFGGHITPENIIYIVNYFDNMDFIRAFQLDYMSGLYTNPAEIVAFVELHGYKTFNELVLVVGGDPNLIFNVFF